MIELPESISLIFFQSSEENVSAMCFGFSPALLPLLLKGFSESRVKLPEFLTSLDSFFVFEPFSSIILEKLFPLMSSLLPNVSTNVLLMGERIRGAFSVNDFSSNSLNSLM